MGLRGAAEGENAAGVGLLKNVLPLSRLLAGDTFRRRTGVSRNMGAMRSLEYSFASMVVGCMNRMELGSWSMMYPMMLFSSSDFPTWEEDTRISRRTFGSVKASMMARR